MHLLVKRNFDVNSTQVANLDTNAELDVGISNVLSIGCLRTDRPFAIAHNFKVC